MSAATDRNLLAGLLALQMGFIDRTQLIQGMSRWVSHPASPLEEHLFHSGALTRESQEKLKSVVAVHLQNHGHSPRTSLQKLASLDIAEKELYEVGDSDLQESVSLVSTLGFESPTRTAPFVPAPATTTSTGTAADRRSAPGRFTVVRPHAKGGLGQVSIALDEELHREVALKEIQPRFEDIQSCRERFVLEAEVTGNLEHPGIVPVYSLGADDQGRPFYAMRFIQGASFTTACDKFHSVDWTDPGERSLQFRKLLGHFVDVCHAIEYAHSRGVLHRDLKPDNVMLGDYGETLVVDWGLAKAGGAVSDNGSQSLNPRADDGIATQVGSVMGTPAFMSPEQAEGRADELTAATDVYGLGATLYYLLTGVVPFSGKTAAVMEQVRSGQFEHPRAVLDTVPPPLAFVCLKAMAHQPHDRYETAAALAKDVENWLADEPVSAYPEPAIDRARRFVRRHQTAVSSLAVTIVVAVISLAFVTAKIGAANKRLTDANRTILQRNEKITKQNQEITDKNSVIEGQNETLRTTNLKLVAARNDAEAKRKEAVLSRNRSRRTVGYLVRALSSPRPEKRGREVTVVEVLDQAYANLGKELTNDPVILGMLAEAIGITYNSLELHDKAIAAGQLAMRSFRKHRGPNHAMTLRATFGLASLYLEADRMLPAIPLLESFLAARQSKKFSPDEVLLLKDYSTDRARLLLGRAHKDAGNFEQAIALLDKLLDDQSSRLGPTHDDTLSTMSALGSAYDAGQKQNRALKLHQIVLKARTTKNGPKHKKTLTAMHKLASSMLEARQFSKSKQMFEQVVRLRTDTLGKKDQATLNSSTLLAHCYLRMGQPQQAKQLFEQVIELTKTTLGPGHPANLDTMVHLAEAYQALGQYDDSVKTLRSTLSLLRTTLGRDHRRTLKSMSYLGDVLLDTGQAKSAVSILEEAARLTKSKLGDSHLESLERMTHLGQAYSLAALPKKAIATLTEANRRAKQELGEDHKITLGSMNRLIDAYRLSGDVARSVSLARQALQRRTSALVPGHEQTIIAAEALVEGLLRTGNFEQAIPHAERAHAFYRSHRGPAHPHTLRAAMKLSSAYAHSRGRQRDGLRLASNTVRIATSKLGKRHPMTIAAMYSLAIVYRDLRLHGRTVDMLEQTLALQQSVLGEKHPKTVNTMVDLGLVYVAARKIKKAIPLLKTTLRIRRSEFGPSHRETVSPAFGLAWAYDSSGQPQPAIELLRQTLPIAKAEFGSRDKVTIGILRFLGRAYYRSGKFPDAIARLKEALTAITSTNGEQHRDAIRVMDLLSRAHFAAGERGQSKRIAEKALALLEASQSKDYRYKARVIEHLALLHETDKRFDEAIGFHNQRLKLERSQPKANPLALGGIHAAIGDCHLKTRNWAQAAKHLRACLKIRKATTPNSWLTANAQSMLGEALTAQQKFKEAEPLLKQGFDRLTKLKNQIHPRIRATRLAIAARRLVTLYEAWKKPAEAKKWREREERLRKNDGRGLQQAKE